MIWEVKHALFTPKDEDEMPGEPTHLMVARNVLDTNEVKFFVSNAPAETPVQKLLLVGFSRWRVERCFEDQKGEIGLDHYEGRRYPGLKRHLILSAVSSLFLAEMRQEFGGEKSGVDRVPGAYSTGGLDPVLVAGPASLAEVARAHGVGVAEDAAEECHGAEEPHQDHATKAPCVRHQTHRTPPLQMGADSVPLGY